MFNGHIVIIIVMNFRKNVFNHKQFFHQGFLAFLQIFLKRKIIPVYSIYILMCGYTIILELTYLTYIAAPLCYEG